jgi:hypothetical protein
MLLSGVITRRKLEGFLVSNKVICPGLSLVDTRELNIQRSLRGWMLQHNIKWFTCLGVGRRKSTVLLVGKKLASICSWNALLRDIMKEPYWDEVQRIRGTALKLGIFHAL